MFSRFLRSGLRAWIEDADDIGWLRLGNSALEFNGDGLKLVVPYANLQQLRTESIVDVRPGQQRLNDRFHFVRVSALAEVGNTLDQALHTSNVP